MKKIHKDILRYVILIAVSVFAVVNTADITMFAFNSPDMKTPIAGLLGAISTSVLGTWGYYIKKFAETSAGDKDATVS